MTKPTKDQIEQAIDIAFFNSVKKVADGRLKLSREQIDQATPEQLAELIAVHCMGWSKTTHGRLNGFSWYRPDTDDFEHHWQPHLPTEKGKAQCWDLARKYGLSVDFETGEITGSGASLRDLDLQIAVLRAILYSVIGE